METLKNRIVKLLDTLNERVYGKEEVMALALLSAVAGESIFLLGPPGVAKSMVARRLKLMFRGGTAFEYLMSRFSTPDEIFGPVSIARLKNEDTYERMTEGYLPAATVVFLDEIWKAGPAIQNALLTVINEKIFRNGQFSVRVPMKGLIAASNELPASGQGLEALYDLFLVRKLVGGIEDLSDFDRMISTADESEPEIDEHLAVSDEEYRQWQEQMKSVGLHYSVLEVIHYTALHRLPQAPSFLPGVVNLRGSILPVINMVDLLTLQGGELPDEHGLIIICEARGMKLGLLVSRLHTIHKAKQDKFNWNAELHLGSSAELLSGLLETDEKLLGILSVERLVAKLLEG